MDIARLGFEVDTSGIRQASIRTRELTNEAGRAAAAMIAIGAAAAVAAAAVVRQMANTERELVNAAKIAGATRDEMEQAAYATSSLGIEMDNLADISKDLQDKIGDFIANEGGEFTDFYNNVASRVGLTIDALQKMSGPEALIAVKKAMDDANVSTEEQIFYLEALASDSALLIPLLENEGRLFRQMSADAKELGLSLSAVDSQKLLDASYASKRLDTAVMSLHRRMTIDLAPAVTNISNLFADIYASGSGQRFFESISFQIDYFVRDLESSRKIIDAYADSNKEAFQGMGDFISEAFWHLPLNARAAVQLLAVELATLVDYGTAYGKAFGQSLGVALGQTVVEAKIYGRAIAEAANPFSDFDLDAALADARNTASGMIDEFYSEAEKQIEAARSARLASITNIVDERNAAVASFDVQIKSAGDLLDQYQKLRAARDNKIPDQTGTGGRKSLSDPAKAKAESDAIAKHSADAMSAIDALNQEFMSEEDRLIQTMQEQKYQIANALAQDVISTQEANDLKLESERKYFEGVQQLNAQKRADDQAMLAYASDTAGNLAQIAKAGGSQQFEAYKLFASAQATIASYLAATKALAEVPYPLNIVAAASIAALGAIQVAQIQAQDYQPSYLGGGYTGSAPRTGGVDGMGGFPAILHPNEAVFDLTRGTGMAVAANSGGPAPMNVTINNTQSGVSNVSARQIDGRLIVDVIAADAARGGKASRALARANGGRRARR